MLGKRGVTAPATISLLVQSRSSTQHVLDSVQTLNVPKKSFAAVLDRRSSTDDAPLPVPCIKGDVLCIEIG